MNSILLNALLKNLCTFSCISSSKESRHIKNAKVENAIPNLSQTDLEMAKYYLAYLYLIVSSKFAKDAVLKIAKMFGLSFSEIDEASKIIERNSLHE